MKHKVTCMACSKKGIVEVEKGKKVRDKNWYYFGKTDLNGIARSKFLYKVISLKDWKTEKVMNTEYDKNAKPRIVEQWECRECWNEHTKKSIK